MSAGGILVPLADFYDLYGTDANERGTIPFDVNWPNPPDTSSELTVNDASSFSTALGSANARITVEAGSYGPFIPTANDQNWIMDDAANFSGWSVSSRSRLRVDGGIFTFTAGDFNLADASTDVLLNNVRMDIAGSAAAPLTYNAVRVALVQTTLDSEGYGLFPTMFVGSTKIQDLIVAGCYIIGLDGSRNALRIERTERAIVVDTRLRSADHRPGLRSHRGTSDYWARRVLFEDCGGLLHTPTTGAAWGGSVDYQGDHWIYDMEHYAPTGTQGWVYNLDIDTDITGGDGLDVAHPGDINIAGNRSYDSDGLYGGLGNTIGGTIAASDNTVGAGASAPALGSWLTANGIAPGADH